MSESRWGQRSRHFYAATGQHLLSRRRLLILKDDFGVILRLLSADASVKEVFADIDAAELIGPMPASRGDFGRHCEARFTEPVYSSA